MCIGKCLKSVKEKRIVPPEKKSMDIQSRLLRQAALSAAESVVLDGTPWAAARDCAQNENGIRIRSDVLESAVRETWATFKPRNHESLLHEKRLCALKALRLLTPFDAWLCGAVLNGCAGPETSIRIEVFEDDAKSVLLFLLDAGIDAQAIDDEPSPVGKQDLTLGFLLKNDICGDFEAIRIEIFPKHFKSRNPRKRTPDAWQSPWEASGRISAENLAEVLVLP